MAEGSMQTPSTSAETSSGGQSAAQAAKAKAPGRTGPRTSTPTVRDEAKESGVATIRAARQMLEIDVVNSPAPPRPPVPESVEKGPPLPAEVPGPRSWAPGPRAAAPVQVSPPPREQRRGSHWRALVALGVVIAAGVAVVLVVLDRGGEDTSKEATFRDGRFGLTFTYPGSFHEGAVTGVAGRIGAGPDASVALAIDEDNGITIEKYDVGGIVTIENLGEIAGWFDAAIAQVTGVAVTGTRVDIGGLPGLTYGPVAVPGEPGRQSRFLFLFDGNTEYSINCQWTPDRQTAVNAACDRVLATLHRS